MLNWIRKKIEYLYDKKVDASGLSLFRIFYSLVLLGEVAQFYFFRHLMFDKVPYVDPSEIDFSIPLIIWMICLLMLCVGLYTRFVSILNYIFSLIFISTAHAYEYHMFFIYMGVNFVLMFIHTGRYLSIDSILLKLKYSSTRTVFKSPTVTPVLNYFVLVLVGIGFMYFDSVFYKFMANLWTSGLGVWLPSSIPQAVYIDHTFLLNQKWLMIPMGYLTLLFEAFFIFLFWFKRFRISLLVIGVGLHLGILFVYPIPWFALGFIALYILMVPVGCWTKLKKIIAMNAPRLTLYYDDECPICLRTRVVLSSLDPFHAIQSKSVQHYASAEPALAHLTKEELYDSIYSVDKKGKVYKGIDTYTQAFTYLPLFFPLSILLRIPGIYHIAKAVYQRVSNNRNVERCTDDNCGYIAPPVIPDHDAIKLLRNLKVKDLRLGFIRWALILLLCLQLISIYNSHLVKYVTTQIGFEKTYLGKVTRFVVRRIQIGTKVMLGITGHTVFLDNHFEGYHHIIAIQYEGDHEYLPIINADGMPDYYQIGPTWAKWAFRANGATVDMTKLESGIRDFTAFWLGKQGLSFDKRKFVVYVKKIDPVTRWKKDFLKEQKQKPWIKAGTVEWQDKNFVANIQDIESL